MGDHERIEIKVNSLFCSTRLAFKHNLNEKEVRKIIEDSEFEEAYSDEGNCGRIVLGMTNNGHRVSVIVYPSGYLSLFGFKSIEEAEAMASHVQKDLMKNCKRVFQD